MRAKTYRSHNFRIIPSLNKRRSAGFTFLEIIIITLIIGIITLLSWPSLIAAVEDARLNGAATETVTALEFAHSKAVNAGRTIRVTFDVATDTFVIEQFTYNGDLLGGADTLTEADVETGNFTTMQHPLRPGDNYQIDLAGQALFGGVDISAVNFGGNNYVTFDAHGAPSIGGTVALDFGGRQMVVALDSLTGKVTVIK